MPKVSTSIARPDPLAAALTAAPSELRGPLTSAYLGVRAAYAEGSHDTVGLRAGHLAEVLLRILQQALDGKFTPLGQKLPNFINECTRLSNSPAAPGDEGLRVLMPRALAFLYTLRNKRGIGHVGGDINPNEIDSATCARIADWCMCELIRTYRSIPIEEAQALLDAISVRQIPEVWNVGGKRRVLDTSLDYKSQVLVLLFGEEQAVPIEDLCSWVDHPRLRDFRRDVLLPLHRERVIEYDAQSETATLSPTGARIVEDRLRPE